MLIKETDSLDEAFRTIKHELNRGTLDRRHPFRFVVFSTASGNKPFSRYVVLRKISENLNMLIYTDTRSGKIDQIKENEHANLLFWNPGKRIQVRVEGMPWIVDDRKMYDQTWDAMSDESKRAYLNKLAPGAEIDSPEQGWESIHDTQDHFSIIEFKPSQIEFLQLNADRLLRASYRKDTKWIGKWLVP
jgi:pyridoxine/pyridoxamine 5'-phosphate oxidase